MDGNLANSGQWATLLSVKRESVFFVLAGFFITNALLAELAGAKLIRIGPSFVTTVGVLVWPIVFLTTDLVNEYFGKSGVRKLTYLTVGLIAYSFVALSFMINFPAADISSVSDEQYNSVFAQSKWVIVGSIIAFLVSQLIDVMVFWFLRQRTGAKMLWLRATGSTAVSQLIDTFVILGIAFWLTGAWTTETYFQVSLSNYVYKLGIAVMITPLIYGAHNLIDRYLGKEAEAIIEQTARENVKH